MHNDRKLIASEYATMGRNKFIDLSQPGSIYSKELKKAIRNKGKERTKGKEYKGISNAQEMYDNTVNEDNDVDNDKYFAEEGLEK